MGIGLCWAISLVNVELMVEWWFGILNVLISMGLVIYPESTSEISWVLSLERLLSFPFWLCLFPIWWE